jgi:hypothetical protein
MTQKEIQETKDKLKHAIHLICKAFGDNQIDPQIGHMACFIMVEEAKKKGELVILNVNQIDWKGLVKN